jgi:hypothetical protein
VHVPNYEVEKMHTKPEEPNVYIEEFIGRDFERELASFKCPPYTSELIEKLVNFNDKLKQELLAKNISANSDTVISGYFSSHPSKRNTRIRALFEVINSPKNKGKSSGELAKDWEDQLESGKKELVDKFLKIGENPLQLDVRELKDTIQGSTQSPLYVYLGEIEIEKAIMAGFEGCDVDKKRYLLSLSTKLVDVLEQKRLLFNYHEFTLFKALLKALEAESDAELRRRVESLPTPLPTIQETLDVFSGEHIFDKNNPESMRMFFKKWHAASNYIPEIQKKSEAVPRTEKKKEQPKQNLYVVTDPIDYKGGPDIDSIQWLIRTSQPSQESPLGITPAQNYTLIAPGQKFSRSGGYPNWETDRIIPEDRRKTATVVLTHADESKKLTPMEIIRDSHEFIKIRAKDKEGIELPVLLLRTEEGGEYRFESSVVQSRCNKIVKVWEVPKEPDQNTIYLVKKADGNTPCWYAYWYENNILTSRQLREEIVTKINKRMVGATTLSRNPKVASNDALDQVISLLGYRPKIDRKDPIPLYFRPKAYKESIKRELEKKLTDLVTQRRKEGFKGPIQANIMLLGFSYFEQLGKYNDGVLDIFYSLAIEAYREAVAAFNQSQQNRAAGQPYIAAVRVSLPEQFSSRGKELFSSQEGEIVFGTTTHPVDDLREQLVEHAEQAVFVDSNSDRRSGIFANFPCAWKTFNLFLNAMRVRCYSFSSKEYPPTSFYSEEEMNQHEVNIKRISELYKAFSFKKSIEYNQLIRLLPERQDKSFIQQFEKIDYKDNEQILKGPAAIQAILTSRLQKNISPNYMLVWKKTSSEGHNKWSLYHLDHDHELVSIDDVNKVPELKELSALLNRRDFTTVTSSHEVTIKIQCAIDDVYSRDKTALITNFIHCMTGTALNSEAGKGFEEICCRVFSSISNLNTSVEKEKFWAGIVKLCKEQVRNPKENDPPYISLLYRAIAESDANLARWPKIQTLPQLLIAQQKRDAISNQILKEYKRLMAIRVKENKHSSTSLTMKLSAYECLAHQILSSNEDSPLSTVLSQALATKVKRGDQYYGISTEKGVILQDTKTSSVTIEQALSYKRGLLSKLGLGYEQATSQLNLNKLRNELLDMASPEILNLVQPGSSNEALVNYDDDPLLVEKEEISADEDPLLVEKEEISAGKRWLPLMNDIIKRFIDLTPSRFERKSATLLQIYELIMDYFVGNRLPEELWANIVELCKKQSKDTEKNGPHLSLLYRAIAESDDNLHQWPGIETLHQLLIAQQKRDAISNHFDKEWVRLKIEQRKAKITDPLDMKLDAYNSLVKKIKSPNTLNVPLSTILDVDASFLTSSVDSGEKLFYRISPEEGVRGYRDPNPPAVSIKDALSHQRGRGRQATSDIKLDRLRDELFDRDPLKALNFAPSPLLFPRGEIPLIYVYLGGLQTLIVSKVSKQKGDNASLLAKTRSIIPENADIIKLAELAENLAENIENLFGEIHAIIPENADIIKLAENIGNLFGEIHAIIPENATEEKSTDLIFGKIKQALKKVERDLRNKSSYGFFGKKKYKDDLAYKVTLEHFLKKCSSCDAYPQEEMVGLKLLRMHLDNHRLKDPKDPIVSEIYLKIKNYKETPNYKRKENPWPKIVTLCKNYLDQEGEKNLDVSLLCRAITEFNDNVVLFRNIETWTQLLIAQQKRDVLKKLGSDEKYEELTNEIVWSCKNETFSTIFAEDSSCSKDELKDELFSLDLSKPLNFENSYSAKSDYYPTDLDKNPTYLELRATFQLLPECHQKTLGKYMDKLKDYICGTLPKEGCDEARYAALIIAAVNKAQREAERAMKRHSRSRETQWIFVYKGVLDSFLKKMSKSKSELPSGNGGSNDKSDSTPITLTS